MKCKIYLDERYGVSFAMHSCLMSFAMHSCLMSDVMMSDVVCYAFMSDVHHPPQHLSSVSPAGASILLHLRRTLRGNSGC